MNYCEKKIKDFVLRPSKNSYGGAMQLLHSLKFPLLLKNTG